MRYLFLRLPLLAWALMSFGVAFAADLAPAQKREVRATIEAQLAALAADDAARAYAYAAPGIRAQFRDPAAFLEMVHRAYPMLIRPRSVSFFGPDESDGVVVQAVQFRDADGRYWRAVYQLRRAADQRWRIEGCAVAPASDAGVT